MEQERRVDLEQLLPTGVENLDRLLRGGLRAGGTHLITGSPGTGKTLLAHQIASTRVREGQHVLYCTVLVESHDTLLWQARMFDFFDASQVGTRFQYLSLYGALERSGLRGAREELVRVVSTGGAALLIVDGTEVLKAATESRLAFYRLLNEIQSAATHNETTTLLLATADVESQIDPRYTIADAILRLRRERTARRVYRTIEVVKMRGRAHMSGAHTFVIGKAGLAVAPRLEEVFRTEHMPQAGASPERVGLGVDGLDEMLHGGVQRGSITHIVGTPGAAKSLTGLSFCAAGVAAGENCLLLSFQETPPRIVEKARGVALDLRAGEVPGVDILWRPSIGLDADRLAQTLLERIEQQQLRRVVIDGLDDLMRGVYPEDRRIDFVHALADVLRARDVTALMIQETTALFTFDFELPQPAISASADNALLVRHVELRGALRKVVAVMKVRDSGYDERIRLLDVTDRGIVVRESVEDAELVLSGMGRARHRAEAP